MNSTDGAVDKLVSEFMNDLKDDHDATKVYAKGTLGNLDCLKDCLRKGYRLEGPNRGSVNIPRRFRKKAKMTKKEHPAMRDYRNRQHLRTLQSKADKTKQAIKDLVSLTEEYGGYESE